MKRPLAAGLALVGAVVALTAARPAAARETPAAPAPIGAVQDVVVDDVHGHVFVAGLAGLGVYSGAGQLQTVVPGTAHAVLVHGDTVYVGTDSGIRRFAAATLAERAPLVDNIRDVDDLAWSGGGIWACASAFDDHGSYLVSVAADGLLGEPAGPCRNLLGSDARGGMLWMTSVDRGQTFVARMTTGSGRATERARYVESVAIGASAVSVDGTRLVVVAAPSGRARVAEVDATTMRGTGRTYGLPWAPDQIVAFGTGTDAGIVVLDDSAPAAARLVVRPMAGTGGPETVKVPERLGAVAVSADGHRIYAAGLGGDTPTLRVILR